MTYVPLDQALKHPLRALIHGFVHLHPGVRLGELAECLALENSTLLWHLRKLEGANLVLRLDRPGARVYWSTKDGAEAKELAGRVAWLNTERRRAVLAEVVAEPGTTMPDVAKRLDIDAAAARAAAGQLEDAGLVERIEGTGAHQFFPGSDAAHALDVAERIQRSIERQAET